MATQKNARLIRGYRDDSGHWHRPRTACCGAYVVYQHADTGRFVLWNGYEDEEVPDDLMCAACNQSVGDR